MGCISSRDLKQFPSLPILHGSKRREQHTSSHDVSLTFSTLNSLRLDPETSIKTDGPDELESINSWELMEGLDEPLHSSVPHNSLQFWLQKKEQKHEIDPQFITNFRKAMTELSPQHPTLLREIPKIPKISGIVKAKVAIFEEKIRRRRSFNSASSIKIPSLPNGKGKLVLFSTSLRGVRKTYEDCCNAKAIIGSYGVRIDERDVSMHGGFREELGEIVGIFGSRLPKVFADGRYLGGLEELERMHEDGELGEVLKDCEVCGNGVGCELCGDYRFMPCENCSGSCKVFLEEEGGEIGGFRRCVECNENGLVRCHLCY